MVHENWNTEFSFYGSWKSPVTWPSNRTIYFLKIKAELKKNQNYHFREKRKGLFFPVEKLSSNWFNPGIAKEDTFPTRSITPLEPIFPNTEERKSLGLRALQPVMPRLRGERLLPIEKSWLTRGYKEKMYAPNWVCKRINSCELL